MQIKEYLARFYEGLVVGSKETADAIAQALLAECQAEFSTYGKGASMSDARSCVYKFNCKGNEIADRINTKAGRSVMKKDWFKEIVSVTTQSKSEEAKYWDDIM